MTGYRHEEVSQRLVAELVQMLLQRKSAVLLSPRFIGKRYVIAHVRKALRNHPDAGPLVEIQWLSDRPGGMRQDAVEIVNEAVRSAANCVGLAVSQGADLFDALDDLCARAGRPVLVLAANVDAMGHQLARTFLQGVQARVESGQCVALLGGEEDVRDMVRGPTSDFRCANLFVLQRFARDEFGRFFDRYAGRGMRIKFDSPEAACEHFFQLTGGHTYLLRRVLWQLAERRALFELELPDAIAVKDIDRLLGATEIGSVSYSEPMLFATQMIAREPESWEMLEKLIREGSLEVDWMGNQPSTLELAGVAVFDHGRLRFASSLMESFIRRHYDDRRFGDLHARHGQWGKAFDRYKRLSEECFLRPSGAEDRLDMEFTIAALCTALRSESVHSSERVWELLESGCRYLLALKVAKYQRPPSSKDWITASDTAELVAGVVGDVKRLLAGIEVEHPGVVPLSGPVDDYVVAALLPALRTDEQIAVVVGNLDGSNTISREQRRLARSLLEHFVDAFSVAVQAERGRYRLWIQEQHEQIIDSIYRSLGVHILDVGQALTLAAKGLRHLGYRRVLFCLVDPQGDRIQGVLDDADDGGVSVADMTDWPLADAPPQDLQPLVVTTGQPKRVPDVRSEPLANLSVWVPARMTALAIVPILNARGRAIGTIHVERQDGRVPSQEEVDDLMAFGRRLAVAIEQSQRVNLLQSAIDQSTNPVVIVDPQQRLLYANKPAHDMFGVGIGWSADIQSQVPGQTTLEGPQAMLIRALEMEHRQFCHLPRIGLAPDGEGAAVVADVIRDWRKRVVGAFVHVNYLKDLKGVLEACQLLARAADTESAVQAILEATQSLGHKWGRLYLLSEGAPPCLEGKRAFGVDCPTIDEDFHAGRVRLLPPSEATEETWLCIKTRDPCVFAWNEDCPNHETFETPKGLVVHNVWDPKCPERVRKKRGDYWIDFPLVTSAKVLGKITLQCDEDMLPEHLELLRVLSRLASTVLDALREKDETLRERIKYTHIERDVAEKTLATAAHNINTRIASLPAILARYQRHESRYPQLVPVNADFQHVLHETMGVIENIKKRLTPIVLKLESIDLAARLRRALEAALPPGTWTLSNSPSVPEISADGHLLETAFLELVDNSLQAVGRREDLHLRVDLREGDGPGAVGVQLRVLDNGPGVPAEGKELIFEDFYTHRPNRESGIGLGLGFVRRVIRAHGGTIQERGQPGHGAEFVIDLPQRPMISAEQGRKEDSHVSISGR